MRNVGRRVAFAVAVILLGGVTAGAKGGAATLSRPSEPAQSTPPATASAQQAAPGSFEAELLASLQGTSVGTYLERASTFLAQALSGRVPGVGPADVITAIASSDGILVVVTESAYSEANVKAMAEALPGVPVKVTASTPLAYASQVVGGSGLESSTGPGRCSAAFTVYEQAGGVYNWYSVTAGHCFTSVPNCVVPFTPARHHDLTHAIGSAHTTSLSVSGANPVLFPAAGATAPYDDAAVFLGSSSSLSAPDADASKLVYSGSAPFAVRQVASVSDTGLLGTTGVTFERYGHTSGPETDEVYVGIAPTVPSPCGDRNHAWMIVTDTGTDGGCAGGDSGGPLTEVYWPQGPSSPVSVLGVLSFTGDGPGSDVLCYWAQPGFAMEAWGTSLYGFYSP